MMFGRPSMLPHAPELAFALDPPLILVALGPGLGHFVARALERGAAGAAELRGDAWRALAVVPLARRRRFGGGEPAADASVIDRDHGAEVLRDQFLSAGEEDVGASRSHPVEVARKL